MHEHGVIDRLLALALQKAKERGASLRVVRVCVGALYPTPERFEQDFAHVCEHFGVRVQLQLDIDPLRPTGVELQSIEVQESQ